MSTRRVLQSAAAAGIALACLASSMHPAAAAFSPGDEEGIPDSAAPAYVPRPDLRFTSGTARATSTGWELTYSIRNAGDLSAEASTTAFKRDGTLAMASAAEAPLAAGASRTRTVTLPRTTCWAAIRVDLDSADALAEHTNRDNQGWVIGQAASTCADAAQYRLRVIDLKAVAAQEAADEPYLVLSSVSDGPGSTWTTLPGSGVADGESAYVPFAQRCIWGTPTSSTCEGRRAPTGIGISAEVMEHDSGDLTKVRETVDEAFKYVGPILAVLAPEWAKAAVPIMDDAIDEVLAWFDDDQIGTNTWAYSATDLARLVPTVGTSIRETRAFANGDRAAGAFYHLTLELTRTA